MLCREKASALRQGDKVVVEGSGLSDKDFFDGDATVRHQPQLQTRILLLFVLLSVVTYTESCSFFLCALSQILPFEQTL